MGNDTSRILIETIVRKTLREIKASPGRSTRNLIDMALNFSEGRFQRNFFEAAQTMLTNEKSPYYELIRDTVAHVDCERLLQFGMNVGYHGCTVGARKIREIEEKEHYNIPWMLSLCLDSETFCRNQKAYQTIISEGESLGIHAWILVSKDCPQEALFLVREHPESGFALMITPDEASEEFLKEASEAYNLMLVIRCGEGAAEVCCKMREKELLYGVCDFYTAETAKQITDGSFFAEAQKLHPAVTMAVAASDCPEAVIEEVYGYVKSARDRQLFRTVVWEAGCDSILVDSIISQDACLAWFDAEGQLITQAGRTKEACCNLLESSLQDILRHTFPKKRQNLAAGQGG